MQVCVCMRGCGCCAEAGVWTRMCVGLGITAVLPPCSPPRPSGLLLLGDSISGITVLQEVLGVLGEKQHLEQGFHQGGECLGIVWGVLLMQWAVTEERWVLPLCFPPMHPLALSLQTQCRLSPPCTPGPAKDDHWDFTELSAPWSWRPKLCGSTCGMRSPTVGLFEGMSSVSQE